MKAFCAQVGLSLLSLSLLGCQKKDSEPLSTTGSFLTPAEFSSATPQQITSATALSRLQSASEIYDNKPASGSTTAEADGLTKCMKSNFPVANVAEKSTLIFDLNKDILQCYLTEMNAPSGAVSGSLTLRMFAKVSCPGADLTSFQGKTLEAVTSTGSEAEKQCTALAAYQMYLNVGLDVRITNSQTNKSVDLKVRSAIFNKNGQACDIKKVAGGSKIDGCLYAESATSNESGKVAIDLSILESSNLQSSTDQTALWFTGGSYNVTLNNFTGTLTYSGASVAPSYTLTNGTNTISGTLSGLALTTDGGLPVAGVQSLLAKAIASIEETAQNKLNSLQ